MNTIQHLIKSEKIVLDDSKVYETLDYYEMNLYFDSSEEKFLNIKKEVLNTNNMLVNVFKKETEKIVNRFVKSDIKYVLLVGIPFAQRFHDDMKLRLQEDIDFLIDENDFVRAEKVMEKLGYFAWNEDAKRKHVTFIKNGVHGKDLSTDGRIAIKLYRRLSDFQFGELTYKKYVDHIKEYNGYRIFDNEMTLVHLIIHAHYYDFHPKILADIYMICKNGKLDWKEVNRLIEKYKYIRVGMLVQSIMKSLGIVDWIPFGQDYQDMDFLTEIYNSKIFWGEIFVRLDKNEMTKLRCYIFDEKRFANYYNVFLYEDMCRRVSPMRGTLYIDED